jgi:hypothetical protein
MTINTSAELFSPMQISRLHAEFGKIDRIDPCSPTYDRLISTLNAMSKPQLQQVHDAKIKFLGRLALNRL